LSINCALVGSLYKIQNKNRSTLLELLHSDERSTTISAIYQSTRCNSSEDLRLQNIGTRKWEVYSAPFCFPQILHGLSWEQKWTSVVFSNACYKWRNLLLHYRNTTINLLWRRHLWGNILFRGGIFELQSKFSYPCIGTMVGNTQPNPIWLLRFYELFYLYNLNILLLCTGAINTQEVNYIYFTHIISHLCAYVACVKWSANGNRRAAVMLWVKSFEQTGLLVVIYHFSLFNTTSFPAGIICTRRQRKGGTYFFICLKTLRLMRIVWSGLGRWDTVSLGEMK
jgi:hypothetical protein